MLYVYYATLYVIIIYCKTLFIKVNVNLMYNNLWKSNIYQYIFDMNHSGMLGKSYNYNRPRPPEGAIIRKIVNKFMNHNRDMIDTEMNFCRVSGSAHCGLKIKMC